MSRRWAALRRRREQRRRKLPQRVAKSSLRVAGEVAIEVMAGVVVWAAVWLGGYGA